jgi:hypothetical protein
MSKELETFDQVWDQHVKPILKNPEDWKSPIDGLIPENQYEKINEVVEFLTGTSLEITNTFNTEDTEVLYEVKSPGYAKGPASNF